MLPTSFHATRRWWTPRLTHAVLVLLLERERILLHDVVHRRVVWLQALEAALAALAARAALSSYKYDQD